MPHTFCIGDVHGHADALEALWRTIAPKPDDTLVMLGDSIDRGPDSDRVLDLLLNWSTRVRLVPLRGNHEQMMLDARDGGEPMCRWVLNGGEATLDAYDARTWSDIPAAHLDFLKRTVLHHETDTHFFVHANYDEDHPLTEQYRETLLWRHLSQHVPGPHLSGKTAVVGHTPMGETIFDAGHLLCLDTGCGKGGRLTALQIESRRYWQVDEGGRPVGEGTLEDVGFIDLTQPVLREVTQERPPRGFVHLRRLGDAPPRAEHRVIRHRKARVSVEFSPRAS